MAAKLLLDFQNDFALNEKNFEAKTENVRLLSFNVHMWKNFNNKLKYEEMLELIEKSNADIVGLQEAMLFEKKISNKYKNDFLKMGYEYQVVVNEKHGINILLSKFPITQHKIIKLQQDPVQKLNRYAILSTIDIGTKINVIVTHLDVYDETEETRLKQIKTILIELNKIEQFPTIIMGDFNSLRRSDYSDEKWNEIFEHDRRRNVTPMTLVTDHLEQQKFITPSLEMSVWSMRRVDYIYTRNIDTPQIQLFSSFPTGLSDHYPVYMDISI